MPAHLPLPMVSAAMPAALPWCCPLLLDHAAHLRNTCVQRAYVLPPDRVRCSCCSPAAPAATALTSAGHCAAVFRDRHVIPPPFQVPVMFFIRLRLANGVAGHVREAACIIPPDRT